MIENQLQDPYLWGFLNPKKNYTSRIEYLFDLLFRKEKLKNKNRQIEFDKKFGTDKSSVFRFFQEKISKAGNNLQPVWDEVVLVFEQIEQWYNHPEHYHYIGYLQNYERPKETGDIVFDIMKLSEDDEEYFKSKNDLTDYLIGKIKTNSASWFSNKKITLIYEQKTFRNSGICFFSST